MKAIQLTGEQLRRLQVLAQEIAPYFEYEVKQSGRDKSDISFYIFDPVDGDHIPWLEFCYLYAAPMVAETYRKHHMDCTESWAKHMVLQKLAHEMHKTNPIDLLYDIMTKPGAYAQGL